MSKWPLRPLGELCRQITVGFVGKMADQYVEAGVPFLRSQDILAGRIDVTRLKFISPDFHARIRKSRLVPGDVGIVRTGYPGTAAVVPETLPEANCSDLVIARPGPELEPRYLAFLLNSPWGKAMINGRLVGAAQQHFNVKVAQALQVPTPPIEEQRRIASILGAYDDLIEVNRRRVAVLEEMARGLFEEWFVRFRFPGHEEVAMIGTADGPLPDGWAWGAASNLVHFDPRTRVPREGEKPFRVSPEIPSNASLHKLEEVWVELEHLLQQPVGAAIIQPQAPALQKLVSLHYDGRNGPQTLQL